MLEMIRTLASVFSWWSVWASGLESGTDGDSEVIEVQK
jgi:hypothetical protein